MGFFGVVLEPGQKEPVEVPGGWRLQLCSAILEAKKVDKGKEPKGALWVELEEEDEPDQLKLGSYMLARLQGTGALSQMTLTHSFNSMDDTIYFEAKGSATIHLTGFFTRDMGGDVGDENFGFDEDDEEEEDDDDEEEEEEEEENAAQRLAGSKSRKVAGGHAGLNGRAPRAAAAAAARSWSAEGMKGGDDDEEDDEEYVNEEGDEDEDEDDEDGDEQTVEMMGVEEEDGGDGDEEDGDDDDKEEAKKKDKGGKRGARKPADDSASAHPPTKKPRKEDEASIPKDDGADASKNPEALKKAQKRQRQRESKRKAAEAKRAMDEAFAEEGKEKKKEAPVDVPLKNPTTKMRKGGLKITDIVVGSGAEAQQGKNVKILYQGSFPNGKTFDKNKKRENPFQFRLGMNQVIQGMDRGLLGMRVGGIRKLEVPSALGYGEKAMKDIPPNQDLVFEVELLGVVGKK